MPQLMLFIYLDDQPVGALIEYIEKRDGRTRATFAEVVQIEKTFCCLIKPSTMHCLHYCVQRRYGEVGLICYFLL